MSKVILVRMKLAHEFSDEAQLIADSMRYWLDGTFADELDSWSVEVVNEEPA